MKPLSPDTEPGQGFHASSAATPGGPANPPNPANAVAVRRFIAFSGILALLFSPVFIPMAIYCAGSELNSYILLIPIISGYLFNIKRPGLPAPSGSSMGWVAAMATAGFASGAAFWHWKPLISQNDSYTLIALAFVFFIAAGGFYFLGRKAMAAASFPFAFLLLLAPLPDAVVDALEIGSQLASAEMAGIFFDLFGVPVIHTGTEFQFTDIALRVAQECSGIHSSWILLISSLVACHLILRSFWRQATLLVFAVVLGIVRNGFRILVLGWLCVHYGPQMIDTPIHHHGGPIFFVLSLFPLFLLLWLLRRGEAKQVSVRGTTPNGRTPASDLQPT